ncbi:MAG: heme-binding domain-containing protein [Bacteroidetes bacterium]|nr:heme-binding domain-containing protein [Bacteroidota bacterium]
MKKKILYGLIAILALLQFVRPTRNISAEASPNEINLHYAVPDQVMSTLKYSCYDCHSNNTKYPWYFNIQPVGMWMQSHVNDAKRHLNFSEFGSYEEKKAKHKFEEIEDAASNGWMPLGSYLLIHSDARLTPEQSKAIAEWAGALK